jgi:hypothetical protein
MTEQERAKEFFDDYPLVLRVRDGDHRDRIVKFAAEFSAKRVREELESVCKRLCLKCKLSVEMCADRECDKEAPHHVDDWGTYDCKAVTIRRRIAELEPSKLEAEK